MGGDPAQLVSDDAFELDPGELLEQAACHHQCAVAGAAAHGERIRRCVVENEQARLVVTPSDAQPLDQVGESRLVGWTDGRGPDPAQHVAIRSEVHRRRDRRREQQTDEE